MAELQAIQKLTPPGTTNALLSKDLSFGSLICGDDGTWDTSQAFGCASCHVPNLPLNNGGWVYSEPNPYDPPGNLRPGESPTVNLDLTSEDVRPPRLKPFEGIVWVSAFTDLKLHDIYAGPSDPNIEAIDMNQPAGSPEFFAGNRRFLTRKLWGASRKPN